MSRAGTIQSEEYLAAELEVYRRYLCRIDPFPEPMQRAVENVGLSVYYTMWGPTEFLCTGNLRDYDRTADLSGIPIPTLFTCGAYDEATPESTRFYQSKISGADLVIFEESAHMPHLKETEGYLLVLREFLRRSDGAGPSD